MKQFDKAFGKLWLITLFDFANEIWAFESNFEFAPVVPLNDGCRLTFGRSSFEGKLEYWLGYES